MTTPNHRTPPRLRHVVLQATPFCNLACRYCYLPDKDQRRIMATAVLDGVIDLIEAANPGDTPVEIRWHAGEPLTVGPGFYEAAFSRLSGRLAGRCRWRHSLQTNGTLVDDRWCRLFQDHEVRVGVSIDGPQHLHDRSRRTRNDRGSFHLTMRGIERLHRAGVDFDTISVIDIEVLRHRTPFLDFLAELRPRSMGFNVEETEGQHRSATLGHDDFDRLFADFLTSLIAWERETGIPVRELDRIRYALEGSGYDAANEQATPFGFLNVDVDGNVSSFSPELVGLSHRRYPTFTVGTVWSSWDELLAGTAMDRQSRAIAAGVERCRRSCGYFSVCGGGAPANKLFENGGFESTETAMCRGTVKRVTDALLDDLDRHPGTEPRC